MSKMTDFILQIDEAPTNDERFQEYKNKFDAYFQEVDFTFINSEWYVEQDKDKKWIEKQEEEGEDRPPF